MMTLSSYLSDNGLSHSDFAKRLNVDRVTIWRLATGKRAPSFKLAAAIARATDGKVPASAWAEAFDASSTEAA